MRLQIGISDFDRERGDMPVLPVVNMFAEQAQTEETGIVLQSRPGLVESDNLATTPIDGIFQKDGVLNGAVFTVSNAALYEDGVLVGPMNGGGPFFMDGFEDRLWIAGGQAVWSYDGTTLASVVFPGTNVSKVVIGASRAICLDKDTETYYWSDPLSTTIDGLSFNSATSQPDRLVDMLFMDDILILFGKETVEFHPNTGDADAPFVPLEGRVFERGIKAINCAAEFGTSFAWITNRNQVCIADPENIVSNPGLEQKIEASLNWRLWTFYIEGVEFLALTIDAGTWVFSARSKLWSQMSSYNEANWLPHCYDGDTFGCSIDGRLFQWGSDHLDLDGVLERRFRAGIPLNSGSLQVNSVVLRTNPGTTPYVAGDYENPICEMRVSKDGGKTWGNWRAAYLGAQGEYRKKVQWVGCGMAGRPGLLCEFRTTDPVPFRASDVLINEPYGGF